MKQSRFLLLALFCAFVQVLWAQQDVTYMSYEWNETTQTLTQKENHSYAWPLDIIIDGQISSACNYVEGNVSFKRIIVPYDKEYVIILKDNSTLNTVIHFENYEGKTGTLTIYAQSDGSNKGKLIADARSFSDEDCAGIGGTESKLYRSSANLNCGKLIIHGGDIKAYGAEYGAGIGGADDGNGGNITVYGGTVYADGGEDAAGIGGGEDGDGGTLTVYGGEVFADGTNWAAGIGGGEDGDGGTVRIYGGKVTAWAGGKAGDDGGLAIGGGDTGESRGSLTIGSKMMVHAGQNPGDAANHLFSTKERVPACFYRPYAVIEPCTHPKGSYTVNGTDRDTGTHSLKCPNCDGFNDEKHSFGSDNKCTVCGVEGQTQTIAMYLPEIVGDNAIGYLSTPETRTVAQKAYIYLPTPPDTYLPKNTTFAGWVEGQPTTGESYMKAADEKVLEAGSQYLVGNYTHLKAKYISNNITLANDADNRELIIKNDGKTVPMVTLSGRTLYKDGTWNTICLPFDYDINSDGYNPYKGDGVDVRTLSSSEWDSENKVLTLTFTEAGAITKLEAGVPYLIKWNEGGNDIFEPVFYNVTIKNQKKNADTDYATFLGTYTPVNIYSNGVYNVELYLGTNNTLYYAASDDFKVNSCHAYFSLNGGLYADADGIHNLFDQSFSGARIVLYFGDNEPTGIVDAKEVPQHSEWYSLDGRRLNGIPTQPGIYINNGKKVGIK